MDDSGKDQLASSALAKIQTTKEKLLILLVLMEFNGQHRAIMAVDHFYASCELVLTNIFFENKNKLILQAILMLGLKAK